MTIRFEDIEIDELHEWKCDVCGAKTALGSHDEDERFWCDKCIRGWEAQHKEDWSTGKPLRRQQTADTISKVSKH